MHNQITLVSFRKDCVETTYYVAAVSIGVTDPDRFYM